MTGWIKLYRKLNESSFKTRPLVVALFVHLLLNANHQDKKIIWNLKEMTIKKGQLVTGRKALSKATGISQRSIRTGLTILKSTNTINIEPTNRFSLISVLNWTKYQDKATSQLTNKQPINDQQGATNKNIENILSNDNIPSGDLENIKDKTPKDTGFLLKTLLTYWKTKFSKQFPNIPKQAKAIKSMQTAGYTEEDIKNTIDQLAQDPFWSNKGFDFSIVANQIGKARTKGGQVDWRNEIKKGE